MKINPWRLLVSITGALSVLLMALVGVTIIVKFGLSFPFTIFLGIGIALIAWLLVPVWRKLYQLGLKTAN